MLKIPFIPAPTYSAALQDRSRQDLEGPDLPRLVAGLAAVREQPVLLVRRKVSRRLKVDVGMRLLQVQLRHLARLLDQLVLAVAAERGLVFLTEEIY
jgi:hypothetical protein